MLKCATSLWSANLGDLAADMKRVEPYSERFHLDVADGHYVDSLLFFPDLVKALRKHTRVPFEVHLMTTEADKWLEPFSEAGADRFIFSLDAVPDPAALIARVKALGKTVGFALRIEEPIDLIAPYWGSLDTLCVIGTALGIKGATMDPGVPGKIKQARALIDARGLATDIEADGGIRRNTVPLLAAAGADYIVPGSLMFGEDPAAMRAWLATL
ncbi:MAG: ribulose-phosphate 3-epimerase [Anaerolineales bacterium]|nr:ribulose-phosphate 3-epimerase [Anaerolineales bacterium]